jgi:hypothetical protein
MRGVGSRRVRWIFAGRVVELDVVPAGALRAGQPQMVLIEGDAGIGRSSLAFRFLRRQPGVPVITVSGEMAGARLAYGAVQQLAANPGAETADALAGLELLSCGLRRSAGCRCRTTRSALFAARSIRTGSVRERPGRRYLCGKRPFSTSRFRSPCRGAPGYTNLQGDVLWAWSMWLS